METSTKTALFTTSFFVVVCQLMLLMMSPMAQAQLSTGSLQDETTLDPFTNTTIIASTTYSPGLCRPEYTCEECVKVTGAKCYFCQSNATGMGGCHLYPTENVFPRSSECALSDARWGVCWLNFEALIISMSVIAGLLLLSIGCGVYCCCCRNRRKDDGQELRWERETVERQQRHSDRRAEREAKMNAVRQKYGLTQNTASYNRMT